MNERAFDPSMCLRTVLVGSAAAAVCTKPDGHDDERCEGELVWAGERNTWLAGARPKYVGTRQERDG